MVHPWIHLKFLLMCVSNMYDFYQIMGDIHTIVSTWVYIDISVLKLLKSDTYCSRKNLLILFTNYYGKQSIIFLMKLVGIPYNFSSFSYSFIFSFIKSEYNLSITVISYSMFKHNDSVQSLKQILSFFISNFINFWVVNTSFY